MPSRPVARQSRSWLAEPLQFLQFFRGCLLAEKLAAQFRQARHAVQPCRVPLSSGRVPLSSGPRGRQFFKRQERLAVGIRTTSSGPDRSKRMPNRGLMNPLIGRHRFRASP